MIIHPNRWLPMCLLALVPLVFACAGSYYEDEEEAPAAVSMVQPATWNQARVTSIASELSVAVAELRNEVRNDPVSNIGSGQASARHRLLDTLRVLTNETAHLARQLEKGADRAATRPNYERIGVLSRNAEEDARKVFLHETLIAKVTNAGELWRRLAPYYAGGGR